MFNGLIKKGLIGNYPMKISSEKTTLDFRNFWGLPDITNIKTFDAIVMSSKTCVFYVVINIIGTKNRRDKADRG